MAGSVHGGVVATLCDISLAMATKGPTLQAQVFPTANLNINYLSAARRGEWLEVRAVCSKLGSRMAFATAEVLAGDRLAIATATGVFSRPSRAPGLPGGQRFLNRVACSRTHSAPCDYRIQTVPVPAMAAHPRMMCTIAGAAGVVFCSCAAARYASP